MTTALVYERIEIISGTLTHWRDFFGFPQDIRPAYLFFYTATF
ncbi:MAG TPA: hypothetical protein VKK06_15310 [Terriglobia bacterium]|jgi:hypothetical protein|nr:hypothetical protein [Terriglobia bacterium]